MTYSRADRRKDRIVVRAPALALSLLLLAVSGCGSSTTESPAAEESVAPSHVVDYLVVLNSGISYNTLTVQYADAQGEPTRDSSSSISWTKHVQTNEGVSYLSLVGGAENNGRQPPAGSPVEAPSVQCTITVDGVEASTSVNPFAASCQVNLDTWKPSQAPVGGKVSESPAA
jgi:hypothetical protein